MAAPNPYGGTDVVAQLALQTSDRYLIPAAGHAGIDCSQGNWNVELDFRIVSGQGSRLTSTQNMTRFNIELYPTSNPAALGADFVQLQAGGGGVDAISSISTAPDHASSGRWQTFSCPLDWFLKPATAYAPTPTNVGGVGLGPEKVIRQARIWTRANNGPVIEFGQLRLVRAGDIGLFCLGADDLHASQYNVLFPLAQARGIPLTLWPGNYRALVDQPSRLTKGQITEIIAVGGQLANQAVDTEDYATLLAQTSAKRTGDIDAMTDAQRADFPANLDGWKWGSYFSQFGPHQRSAVYDDYASRFHYMRRFDGGVAAGPPLRWGETGPHSIQRVGLCVNHTLIFFFRPSLLSGFDQFIRRRSRSGHRGGRAAHF